MRLTRYSCEILLRLVLSLPWLRLVLLKLLLELTGKALTWEMAKARILMRLRTCILCRLIRWVGCDRRPSEVPATPTILLYMHRLLHPLAHKRLMLLFTTLVRWHVSVW